MAKFPTLTTLFIIIGFIGVFIAGILGAKLGKHYQASNSKSDTSKILLIIEIILITIEVFKQIFITINEKAYQWDLFPFQICSMIVYVIPLIQLVKSEKAKYSLIGFICFFCMTGGLFYFIKPAAALTSEYMIISLQSFLWHWLIIFTGIFLIYSYRIFEKPQLTMLVGASIVFIVASCIASSINYLVYSINPDMHINFFYISYGEKPFYPVLKTIFKSQHPYPIYFICFLIYFISGTCGIYGICRFVYVIIDKKVYSKNMIETKA